MELILHFFIYLFERNLEYLKNTRKILRFIQSGKLKGIFSIIGLIEVITGPKRKEEFGLAHKYLELIKNFPNLNVITINDKIVEISSDLRAKYRLKTPDAIHLATAIVSEADYFVTNDKNLKRVKEIKIRLLNE